MDLANDDRAAAPSEKETPRPAEATSCCGPTQQETCCTPTEKAECCGTATRQGTCGCR
jgi:hypothetical protein